MIGAKRIVYLILVTWQKQSQWENQQKGWFATKFRIMLSACSCKSRLFETYYSAALKYHAAFWDSRGLVPICMVIPSGYKKKGNFEFIISKHVYIFIFVNCKIRSVETALGFLVLFEARIGQNITVAIIEPNIMEGQTVRRRNKRNKTLFVNLCLFSTQYCGKGKKCVEIISKETEISYNTTTNDWFKLFCRSV